MRTKRDNSSMEMLFIKFRRINVGYCIPVVTRDVIRISQACLPKTHSILIAGREIPQNSTPCALPISKIYFYSKNPTQPKIVYETTFCISGGSLHFVQRLFLALLDFTQTSHTLPIKTAGFGQHLLSSLTNNFSMCTPRLLFLKLKILSYFIIFPK